MDLARLAGCFPAGVLCEIVNEDGTMSRRDQLLDFAREHGLKANTISDLIRATAFAWSSSMPWTPTGRART